VTNCPSGYYAGLISSATVNQFSCLPCNTKCSLCNGSSEYQCLACNPSYYLINKTMCVSNCPSGTYPNSLTATCSLCPATCLTCISLTNCSTCLPNYSLTSTRQCSNTTTNNCTISNCTYCNPSNSSQCSQCNQGFFLVLNQCQTSCPTSTYPTNGICINCSSNCFSCSVSGCNQCITPYLLYNSRCILICPSATLPQNGTCVPDICVAYDINSNNINCTACSSPYLLAPTSNNTITCQLKCPNMTFQSLSKCLPCSTNCLACTSQTACTQCNSITFLSNGQCLSSCPIGSYPSGSNCLSCSDPNCIKCSINTANNQTCQACNPNSNTYFSNGSCLYFCPTGTYADLVTKTCLNCSIGCSKCTNLTYCTACVNNTNAPIYYLPSSGTCIKSCPAGTFPTLNTPYQCTPCSSSCSSCISATNCTSCQGNFYISINYILNISICVDICPDGTYVGISPSFSFFNSNIFACLPCNSPCENCIASTICATCLEGYTLYLTQCLKSCPNGYYNSTYQSTLMTGTLFRGSRCFPCSQICLTCTNSSDICLSCYTGYILKNNSCVSNCTTANTYYSQTFRQCLNCSTFCWTCYGSLLTNCLSCKPPLYLFSNTCINNCPLAYYASSTYECKPCNSAQCANCQGAADNCTLCTTPNLLTIINGKGSCSKVCPTGYYSTSTSATCSLCSTSCLTCSGPANNQCLTCPTGKYLSNNMCVSNCASGYTSVQVTSTQS
jgi:proprotein convertase subtilisin/kexin type 5